MKLKAIKIFLCLVFISVILTAPIIAFGDEPQPGTKTYESMAPIEGISPAKGAVINLSQYLENLYVFLISFAALAAVVMITIGGFTYLTSAAAGSKEDGKSMIRNAISGLLLLLFSWLIINTINPEALKFKFFSSTKNGAGGGIKMADTGYTGTGGQRLIYTNVQTKEVSLKYYNDIKECSAEKERLMAIQIPKYFFPEIAQCRAKNTEEGNKIYTFKYTYNVNPSAEYVAPEETADTKSYGTVTETTKEACEQKRKLVVEKSNVRKPYYVKTECEETFFGKKYAFTVSYPQDEENKHGGFFSDYNSRQWDTIEECAADKKRVSNAIEPYEQIDAQCTEGTYDPDSSSSKKTSTLLYCQTGVIEMTPNGGKEIEDCFKTTTECTDDVKTKKTQKERGYQVSSCLQN